MIIGEDEKLVELKQLHLLKAGCDVIKSDSFYEIEQHLAEVHLVLINHK